MTTLTVKLPEPLAAKLTAAAKKRRIKKAVVVRDALSAYLSKEVRPKEGSFLDLAGDLIGSLEGPGDLSYNKEYLRNYGR